VTKLTALLLGLLPIMLLSAGCAVGPNYKRPIVDIPGTYRGAMPQDAAPPAAESLGVVGRAVVEGAVTAVVGAAAEAAPPQPTSPEAKTTPPIRVSDRKSRRTQSCSMAQSSVSVSRRNGRRRVSFHVFAPARSLPTDRSRRLVHVSRAIARNRLIHRCTKGVAVDWLSEHTTDPKPRRKSVDGTIQEAGHHDGWREPNDPP